MKVLALFTALCLALPVTADDALRKAIRETMTAARYTALITVDDNGQPRARTVDAFLPEEDFTVWIATRPVTRKVAQIRANPKVTLYYWHEASFSYVTVMGSVTLVDDVAVKRSMRRDVDGEQFYPDFPEDYLLIRVEPEWIEGIVPGYQGDPVTWRPSSITP